MPKSRPWGGWGGLKWYVMRIRDPIVDFIVDNGHTDLPHPRINCKRGYVQGTRPMTQYHTPIHRAKVSVSWLELGQGVSSRTWGLALSQAWSLDYHHSRPCDPLNKHEVGCPTVGVGCALIGWGIDTAF